MSDLDEVIRRKAEELKRMAPAITPDVSPAALRARGVRLGLVEDERGLTPTFGGSLTADDRAALAAHREGLLALLLAEARREAARRDDDAAAEGRAVEWGVSAVERWNGGLT